MQRSYFLPALAVLTLVLALPAVAPAAPVVKGPPTFHDRFVEDFVDEDFCGTGESVSVHVEGRETVWEREDAFKVVFNIEASFTHDGLTLVALNAGRLLGIVVPAQGGAARTEEIVETGLRARLKLPNGGVLTSDHGLLHYFISFDENGEVVGVEVLRDRGGHPAFEGDVFCQAATAAFGLPFPG
jgi:hypothetical protein